MAKIVRISKFIEGKKYNLADDIEIPRDLYSYYFEGIDDGDDRLDYTDEWAAVDICKRSFKIKIIIEDL